MWQKKHIDSFSAPNCIHRLMNGQFLQPHTPSPLFALYANWVVSQTKYAMRFEFGVKIKFISTSTKNYNTVNIGKAINILKARIEPFFVCVVVVLFCCYCCVCLNLNWTFLRPVVLISSLCAPQRITMPHNHTWNHFKPARRWFCRRL